MPNFSFLACLEVAEKFVVGGGEFRESTVSNLNPSNIELELVLGYMTITTTAIPGLSIHLGPPT